jgi:hypothetical protein
MVHRRSVLFALALVTTSACDSTLGVNMSGLWGRWQTVPEDLAPQGWHQQELTFNRLGAFTAEVRTYGLYSGQDRTELTASSLTAGTFEVDGGRLIMRPSRLTTWDSWPPARLEVHDPYPWGDTLFDDARFEIVGGDILRLSYTSYPFDAPVATKRTFRRVH